MPEVNVPSISGQVSAVAAGVTPPQANPTKISDILSFARSAQEYQKAKELLPYEIEAGKAQSEQQQLQTALKKQDAIASSFISRINNPLIIQAEANPNAVDKEALVKNIQEWGAQQGKDLGLDPTTTQRLTQPYIDVALNNPAQLRTYLKERHIAGLDQSARTQVAGITPQLTTAGGQPALFNPATGEITQPQVAGAPQGMAPQGQPTGVTPQQMGRPANQQQGIELPYPIRIAGDVRPFAPSEQQDFAQGQAYRDSIVKRAIEIPQSQFNVQQVITKAKELEKTYGKLAESTLTGGITMKLAGAGGETAFKELSKDLAIAQLSNMKALGLDLGTDQGRQLVAAASGDITFPPSVLIKIARRVEADNTNIEMQAQAAQKFATRFGDNNMKAFQQAWAKNTSPEVFQAINVYRDANLNADEKKAMIDKIMGGDESKRKQFFQQYQNIIKLVNTGGL